MESQEKRNRPRISRRSAWYYAVLIGLVVGLNLVFLFYRDEVAALVARATSGLEAVEGNAAESQFVPLGTQLLAQPDIDSTVATFEPAQRLQPPYRVIDSVSLSGEAKGELKLAYVRGIGATDLCLNAKQRKFACGLMGRAALQNRISDEPMTCVPVFYGGGVRRFSCRLDDGTDLSAYQVGTGFARPDVLGRLLLEQPLQHARSIGTGAWQGDWLVLRLEDLERTETDRETPRFQADNADGHD